MNSKQLILEGLPTHITTSKLIFHLLEFTSIKKHQIGRIDRFPSEIHVECIGFDDDDLRDMLHELQDLTIEACRPLAWSKDLKIDPKIKEHFNNLYQYQKAEVESLKKETQTEPFGRFQIIDTEQTIHGSWQIELKQQKVLMVLEQPIKSGTPLIISSKDHKGQTLYVILTKTL